MIWHLAVHDFAIIDYIFPARPYTVAATGMSHVPVQPANTAYVTLFFERSLIAHINVNWLAAVKVRQTLIGGSRKMVVYNDIEPSEKVKVYDKGINVSGSRESIYEVSIGYRTGDMWAPRLSTEEALKVETASFTRCIEEGRTPFNDGNAGVRIVRMLEAATACMEKRGEVVAV